MPYPDRMSTLKPIVSAATVAAMAPPPARTKSPPSCLPGRACLRTPASPDFRRSSTRKMRQSWPHYETGKCRPKSSILRAPKACVRCHTNDEGSVWSVFSARARLADLFHPGRKRVGDPIIRFGFVVEPGNLVEGAIRPGGANRPGVGRRGFGMPDLKGRESRHDRARR